MQTSPLDCLSLFNSPLVFCTEADICIYLPCYQLLSQAHMHTTHCPTQVVLPYLSLFALLLQPNSLFLHLSYYPHLRRVFFPPVLPESACIPLFNKFFQEVFSHFTHSLLASPGPWRSYLRPIPLCYTLLLYAATYVPLAQL